MYAGGLCFLKTEWYPYGGHPLTAGLKSFAWDLSVVLKSFDLCQVAWKAAGGARVLNTQAKFDTQSRVSALAAQSTTQY